MNIDAVRREAGYETMVALRELNRRQIKLEQQTSIVVNNGAPAPDIFVSGLELNIVTTLPSPVPPHTALYVLKRQASGLGDAVYIAIQLSTYAWQLLLLAKRDVG